MKFSYLALLFIFLSFYCFSSKKNKPKSLKRKISLGKLNRIFKKKKNNLESYFRFKEYAKLDSFGKQKKIESLFKLFRLKRFDNHFRFKEGIELEIPKGNVKMSEESDANVGPIVKKGWLKFLKMPLEKTKWKGIKTFFINDNFFLQNKSDKSNCSKPGLSDEWGSFDIPSQFSFFFILAKGSLFIISARKNELARTIYVIPISSLVKQEEGVYIGGVEDQGNFREGFCFKLNQIGESKVNVFVVCADSLTEKEEWMRLISRIKMSAQYIKGDATLEGEALLGGNSYAKEDKAGCDEYSNSGKRDGKWVVLQSWSSCTVSCGGGTQTLQRMCIPPMNGGKDCAGDKIMTRPCNTQPCTNVVNVQEKTETANAKVRVMRVSDRPWIYERCVVKETDVDVVREDMPQFQVKPRVPGRAVLNNRTFTVFQTTDYDSVIFSATLSKVKVGDFKEDPVYCFSVFDDTSESEDRHVSLCALKSSKQDLREIKNKWMEDIEFFRDNCFKPIRRKKENSLNKLRKEEIEIEELSDNANNLESETYQNKAQEAQQGIEDTQQIALNALATEMKFERRMEDEEVRREMLADEKMQLEMEKLKSKQECMKRKFKRESVKSTGEEEVNSINKQMKDLKDQIKNIIIKNRAEKSKKVLFMRKLAERNRKNNFGEMEQVRMKMAADVMKAQKKGNMSLCYDTSCIQKYCNENFLDDPTLMMDCKDSKNFCYICCENEFGMLFPSERSKCLDNCENNNGSGAGNWVWVPSGNQISNSNPSGNPPKNGK